MANHANADSIALHIKHDDDPPFELVASDAQLSNSTLEAVMKGKNREPGDIRVKGGPLTLLDLPVDVLRLIVNEASTAF